MSGVKTNMTRSRGCFALCNLVMKSIFVIKLEWVDFMHKSDRLIQSEIADRLILFTNTHNTSRNEYHKGHCLEVEESQGSSQPYGEILWNNRNPEGGSTIYTYRQIFVTSPTRTRAAEACSETPSHLSVHVVNHLLRESRSPSPIFFIFLR